MNRENLLRERRRGGGDATDGERGGVTAEREEGGGGGGQRERDELVYFGFSRLCSLQVQPRASGLIGRGGGGGHGSDPFLYKEAH